MFSGSYHPTTKLSINNNHNYLFLLINIFSIYVLSCFLELNSLLFYDKYAAGAFNNDLYAFLGFDIVYPESFVVFDLGNIG